MGDDTDSDIKLSGLSVWIEGYELPDSTEYWNANWVVVRILCIGQRSRVEFCDSCVRLSELGQWLEACIALESGKAEEAALPTMEPYFQVIIDRSGDFNGLVTTVKLTPDNVTAFHEFRFSIDQSDLRRLIDSLRRVIARFPIRFAEGR